MLLEGKNAVVYGAAGAVGGAVSRAFAREGAKVFLTGRTQATLDKVAIDIHAAGGMAETAHLDALDESAVTHHADGVAEYAGSIDIAFNAVGDAGILGTPLDQMPYDDFAQPITTVTKSHFLTAKAVAPHMTRQGSGVMLAISGAGKPTPRMGVCEVAWAALETLYTQLAAELGPRGIRVNWLRTGGLPESITPSTLPTGTTADEWCGGTDMTMLKRFASLADVGNTAAFLASDNARAMTATFANITCGAKPD